MEENVMTTTLIDSFAKKVSTLFVCKMCMEDSFSELRGRDMRNMHYEMRDFITYHLTEFLEDNHIKVTRK